MSNKVHKNQREFWGTFYQCTPPNGQILISAFSMYKNFPLFLVVHHTKFSPILIYFYPRPSLELHQTNPKAYGISNQSVVPWWTQGTIYVQSTCSENDIKLYDKAFLIKIQHFLTKNPDSVPDKNSLKLLINHTFYQHTLLS
jgi:hypothetical protein